MADVSATATQAVAVMFLFDKDNNALGRSERWQRHLKAR